MVEQPAALLEIEAGGVVFLALPADADAEVEPATGQHVECRGRLGEDDRATERREKNAGREAHVFRHPRDDTQRRHRLEPMTVGTGGLTPTALASDVRIPVRVELLTEHDVVGNDEAVDTDAVVHACGVEHRRPAAGHVGRVRERARRRAPRHS